MFNSKRIEELEGYVRFLREAMSIMDHKIKRANEKLDSKEREIQAILDFLGAGIYQVSEHMEVRKKKG